MTHRLARRLERAFTGQRVSASSPQGRFAEGAALIDGLVLRRATAYGKHVLADFARGPRSRTGHTLHVHLGLYGRTSFAPVPAGAPVGEVRLRLVGEREVFDLRGPSACEVLDPDGVSAVVGRLGPDPIRADADPERAWSRVSRSRAPIAGLAMDQSVFAGVGNIFRAESLYRNGIGPYREGRDLGRAEFDALWADLVVMMRVALRRGRIDGLRDEDAALVRERRVVRGRGDGSAADRYAGRYYVYGRAGLPCLHCGAEVAWADLAGRTLFWCPTCQPQ